MISDVVDLTGASALQRQTNSHRWISVLIGSTCVYHVHGPLMEIWSAYQLDVRSTGLDEPYERLLSFQFFKMIPLIDQYSTLSDAGAISLSCGCFCRWPVCECEPKDHWLIPIIPGWRTHLAASSSLPPAHNQITTNLVTSSGYLITSPCLLSPLWVVLGDAGMF